MNYELSATNLKDAYQAHIHCAPKGENGPVVLWLAGRPAAPGTAAYDIDGPWVSSAKVDDGDIVGTDCRDETGAITPVRNLIDLIGVMADGNTYVNIHTTANPGGEIRGQIGLVAGFSVP